MAGATGQQTQPAPQSGSVGKGGAQRSSNDTRRLESSAVPNMFQQSAQATQAGMAGAAGEMGFQPMAVSSTDPVTGQPLSAQGISQFFNPYESQVVGGALSDIERARQMQANQLGAQAQAAGAFGGSRQAIMESELGRNALERAAQTAANLRSSGFGQALGASQFAAGQNLQSQLANQAAQLAGSGQRLAAGQQLANIGNIGFGQAQDVQQGLQQQGAMQQMLQQQLIEAAKQQYGGYTGFPAQGLGYYATALGATQVPQTQTTSRQPGLFDYLTLGLSAF